MADEIARVVDVGKMVEDAIVLQKRRKRRRRGRVRRAFGLEGRFFGLSGLSFDRSGAFWFFCRLVAKTAFRKKTRGA
ncbi:MAG: hypothetical protein LBJ64_01195 [Deltaproteobacteria bacterium]|nr:hypothetical protein [Deltaproteobacteria bacterium]